VIPIRSATVAFLLPPSGKVVSCAWSVDSRKVVLINNRKYLLITSVLLFKSTKAMKQELNFFIDAALLKRKVNDWDKWRM